MKHLCEDCEHASATEIGERVFHCELDELEHGYTAECESYEGRMEITVTAERQPDAFYDGMIEGARVVLNMMLKEEVIDDVQVNALVGVFTRMMTDMKNYGVYNTLKPAGEST